MAVDKSVRDLLRLDALRQNMTVIRFEQRLYVRKLRRIRERVPAPIAVVRTVERGERQHHTRGQRRLRHIENVRLRVVGLAVVERVAEFPVPDEQPRRKICALQPHDDLDRVVRQQIFHSGKILRVHFLRFL